MELDSLTSEQQMELSSFINGLNETLETAVQDSTQHAFNFGCSVSVIPLVVLVILVLLLSGFNWVITVGAAVITLLLALGLAAWVAFTARKNSSAQTYRLKISPEIDRNLRRFNLTRPEFESLASEILPTGALLQNYLAGPHLDGPPSPDSQKLSS
jgi:hypothetical protein